MSFFQSVRLAFETIRVQKLKSFFTVIGVTIGVTFLIAVVSIVGGMSRYMQNDLVGKLFAINSFTLRRTPDLQLGDVTQDMLREWRRRPAIEQMDVAPVAAALAPDARWATESGSNLNVESSYANPRKIQCSVVSNGWFAIKNMGVSSGRLIAVQEYTLGSPVVVIGQDVADHFFPNLNPIGRELRIQSIPYTVIGIADKQGSVFGQSLDKFLIAPEKSPLTRWVNPHGVIDDMIIQGSTEDGMREAIEATRGVMRARHKLHGWQPDNFALETPDEALDFWNKLKSYLIIAGVALPAIGLVVGAIVIMNIMLVAVAERTHEIGIRKALGARRSDILRQFLVESSALATIGAAIGVALGFGLAKLVSVLTPLPAAVELWSVVVGVAVGAGVGIIAGAYPASRAALLDPVAAMRQET